MEVAQNYGELLLLHDAASRDQRAVIADACRAMGVEPRRLDPLPQRAHDFLRDAVAAALRAMREDAVVDAKKQRRGMRAGTGPYPYGVETIQFQERADALRRLLGAGFGLPARGGASGDGATRSFGARHYDDEDSEPETAAQLLPAAAAVRLELVPHAPRDPVRVHKRPVGLLAQTTAPAGYVRAARRSAPALRSDEREHKLIEHPTVEPARARVQATAMAKTDVTATQAARAAMLARAQASATIVAVAAPTGGSDGMDEVRALLLERSMRALALNEDGLGVTSKVDDLLRDLLGAAQRAFERRFARSTARLDKSYWRFWTQWCSTLGTPALRSNAAANSGAAPVLHEREVAVALGAFMAWTGENPQFKVSSMLARLRGVARRHKAVGLSFVSLSLVVLAAEGLVQEHIDIHGIDSLRPKSKEPLMVAEIEAMLDLPEGTVIAFGGRRVVVGENIEWQGVRVWISLFCVGGFRKEAVALGVGEKFGARKLSLVSLIYFAMGVIHRAPPIDVLRAIQRLGTMVYIIPCPCKNDTTGEKYGNSPARRRGTRRRKSASREKSSNTS